MGSEDVDHERVEREKRAENERPVEIRTRETRGWLERVISGGPGG